MPGAGGGGTAARLSGRERQVAERYVEGLSYKEIARALSLSPATVRTHLNSIFRKLEVTNRIQLLHQLEAEASAQPVDGQAAAAEATSVPDPPRAERRLAAIVAADVAGYSRLMEHDEAGTVARLKTIQKELVEPLLSRHGGRFVDLKGGGAIVEFHSAVAAVEAAVEIQRAMAAREADRPDAERHFMTNSAIAGMTARGGVLGRTYQPRLRPTSSATYPYAPAGPARTNGRSRLS